VDEIKGGSSKRGDGGNSFMMDLFQWQQLSFPDFLITSLPLFLQWQILQWHHYFYNVKFCNGLRILILTHCQTNSKIIF
jgi:hypothetical protein